MLQIYFLQDATAPSSQQEVVKKFVSWTVHAYSNKKSTLISNDNFLTSFLSGIQRCTIFTWLDLLFTKLLTMDTLIDTLLALLNVQQAYYEAVFFILSHLYKDNGKLASMPVRNRLLAKILQLGDEMSASITDNTIQYASNVLHQLFYHANDNACNLPFFDLVTHVNTIASEKSAAKNWQLAPYVNFIRARKENLYALLAPFCHPQHVPIWFYDVDEERLAKQMNSMKTNAFVMLNSVCQLSMRNACFLIERTSTKSRNCLVWSRKDTNEGVESTSCSNDTSFCNSSVARIL